MEDTNISYTFMANNTSTFIKILAICILEFLLLIIAAIWWLITFWEGAGFSLFLVISVSIALPILTFYLFRNKSYKEITIVLSTTEVKIQWPKKKMVISFGDIESYSACRLHQDTGDIARVCIKLKNGKKIKLTAPSGLCDIEPLKEFREAFDKLAQSLMLPHKLTWEEKLLTKN